MLLNSHYFPFPTLHSSPCSFSLLIWVPLTMSTALPLAVLQQHKPQLDGCQCPFSNRSLQKANSGQGSAGSPTDLWAAPSARQSTSAGLPELPPLPRADATSEHQGYFQPAGVKLPFFLCSHHYLPIKGTLFFCQLIPGD